MFELPLPEFPVLALPSLVFPTLPALPTLPTLPVPLFKFAGSLPSISFPWSPPSHYDTGDTIEVDAPSTGEPGERKTILTYEALNDGMGGDPNANPPPTPPDWGKAEVQDGAVTFKLIKTDKGTAGTCPNTKGDKK
jgi:hypothetical protein